MFCLITGVSIAFTKYSQYSHSKKEIQCPCSEETRHKLSNLESKEGEKQPEIDTTDYFTDSNHCSDDEVDNDMCLSGGYYNENLNISARQNMDNYCKPTLASKEEEKDLIKTEGQKSLNVIDNIDNKLKNSLLSGENPQTEGELSLLVGQLVSTSSARLTRIVPRIKDSERCDRDSRPLKTRKTWPAQGAHRGQRRRFSEESSSKIIEETTCEEVYDGSNLDAENLKQEHQLPHQQLENAVRELDTEPLARRELRGGLVRRVGGTEKCLKEDNSKLFDLYRTPFSPSSSGAFPTYSLRVNGPRWSLPQSSLRQGVTSPGSTCTDQLDLCGRVSSWTAAQLDRGERLKHRALKLGGLLTCLLVVLAAMVLVAVATMPRCCELVGSSYQWMSFEVQFSYVNGPPPI